MGDPEVASADPGSPIERAVTLLMRTNRCDRAAARVILADTARRSGLDDVELADTLITLSAVRRTPRRPL